MAVGRDPLGPWGSLHPPSQIVLCLRARREQPQVPSTLFSEIVTHCLEFTEWVRLAV